MRKLLILSVILAVAGVCFTAAAQEVEKTVNLFRSMDDPDITPDPAICDPGHWGGGAECVPRRQPVGLEHQS